MKLNKKVALCGVSIAVFVLILIGFPSKTSAAPPGTIENIVANAIGAPALDIAAGAIAPLVTFPDWPLGLIIDAVSCDINVVFYCGNGNGSGSVYCGDGACNGSESCSTCSSDCGTCVLGGVCGDGACNGSESCSTCSSDCGVCGSGAYCGDGACNGSESCSTCSSDCGTCGGGNSSQAISGPICVNNTLQYCNVWCTAPGAWCDAASWTSSCAGSWYNDVGYRTPVACCTNADCAYSFVCTSNTCVCADTSWLPDPSTVCIGTNLIQTSNCGRERTMPGTMAGCADLTLSATSPVEYNTPSILTWTPINATNCWGEPWPDGAGEKLFSGENSIPTGDLIENQTYAMTCWNSFSTISKSVSICVHNDVCKSSTCQGTTCIDPCGRAVPGIVAPHTCSNWSPCDKNCGGGTQRRSCLCPQPTPVEEIQACNSQPCPPSYREVAPW
jgi:hypothetical protein